MDNRNDNKKKPIHTSWGKVADWYDDLLEEGAGTYQKEVILPNLLRLMSIQKGETILDLACGQGFFSREFLKSGATVVGVDISSELVEIAKKNSLEGISFFVSPADSLKDIKSHSMDKVVVVLALQNIENLDGVFRECSRVLTQGGRLFLVMNHPTFRIPKASSWGWDEDKKNQFRRIDAYLSESRIPITMNPGKKNSVETISFHRSLQVYFKCLAKNKFSVTRLEEWNSHKKSDKGPRAQAEDTARKEIPLFLFLEAKI